MAGEQCGKYSRIGGSRAIGKNSRQRGAAGRRGTLERSGERHCTAAQLVIGQDRPSHLYGRPVGIAFRGVQKTPVNTDRKSTRLNSSHRCISYAVFCLKKKNKK